MSWVNNQGNNENYCMRGVLLWKREGMGNVLSLLQQSFPSISPGILNLLPSAGFWNTHYTNPQQKQSCHWPSSSRWQKKWQLWLRSRKSHSPSSRPQWILIKGQGLFPTGDQPPHLVKSKQSSWQEKKFFSISKRLKWFHFLSLCFPLFKIIFQYYFLAK